MRRVTLAICLLTVTAASGQTPPCDRTCLINTVDAYLAGLVAHDLSRVALAKDAKFTEDTAVISAGDGIGKTISEAPAKLRVYVPDPIAGQVGFLGVIKESGSFAPGSNGQLRFIEDWSGQGLYPVLLALRLKVQGGQITESETLVHRGMMISPRCTPKQLPEAQKVRCTLLASILPSLETMQARLLPPVPLAERTTREEMLRIADSYYDSLVKSDGRAAPFANDCVRRENAVQTTSASPELAQTSAALIAGGSTDWAKIFSLGCGAQMETRALSYITGIKRRVQIADPETGLVFGLSMFRRPALEQTIKIVGVPGVDTIQRDGAKPSDRVWAHVFKIHGGKLHDIDAMGAVDLMLNSTSGWENTQ